MLYTKIQNLMEESVKNHGIPFAEIAVSKDGKRVLDMKIGDVRENALYRMYSATKPITCTAALQLFEKGEIGLDDPVSDYIPEFKNLKVKIPEGIKDAKALLTLRHLFTMTSGINYNVDSSAIRDIVSKNPNANTMDIVKAIALEPLEFEPGTRWKYGLSHDVLAGVIEVVSQMSFGEYLKKNIFDVCEMENVYLTPGNLVNICPLHIFDANTQRVVPKENVNSLLPTPCYESGGAGLVTDVCNYMKFADTLVNTQKLLKDETLNLMSTPQISGMQALDFSECKKGYSYGLGVRVNADGIFSVKGEFGWDGAAGAYVLFDRKNKIVIFYATHVLSHGAYLYDGLHPALRDAVYSELI